MVDPRLFFWYLVKNAESSISELQDFKIFWWEIFPEPPTS